MCEGKFPPPLPHIFQKPLFDFQLHNNTLPTQDMAWDTLFCSSDRCSPAPQSRWSCWTSWPPASTWPPPPSHPTTRCPSPPPGWDNGRPNVTFYNWKRQKNGFRVCLPEKKMSSSCLFFPFKSSCFCLSRVFCFSKIFCHQERVEWESSLLGQENTLSLCFLLSSSFPFPEFLFLSFQIFLDLQSFCFVFRDLFVTRRDAVERERSLLGQENTSRWRRWPFK